MKLSRRVFTRDGKTESRVFCSCELCRLRFGRLLYIVRGGRPGGAPLGLGRRTRGIGEGIARVSGGIGVPS